MKIYFVVLLVLINCSLFSQTKGVNPLSTSNKQLSTNNTYAVVVGISDYQDKDIPDLSYADKDAEAFANFLRSPAGGSLDGDHLQVLTNSQATAGRIAEAFDALIEKAKKDDQVFIYFSGHGDVEGKKLTQPGFLLCWDSPSRVYMGGGTYSLSFLQEVVSTLSIQNQAKVVVITDACHAGKLAGNQIGGSQLTTSNLAKQYANEVKILSCQPNEFSLEGSQWGGGRGVFSYHLVDGLYGFADRNNDGQITLGEIDRYLEDHVTTEAAPQSQVPILLGNKTNQLAKVNPVILEDLKKNKLNPVSIFAATENRGFEEEILTKADTNIRSLYFAFKQAIKEKRFLSVADSGILRSAEEYYIQLEQLEILKPLRGAMKRNYAAALQDDAQQVINTMLRSGLTELVLSGAIEERLYENYPLYLSRAAELLGKEHYLYRILIARQYFFKGKTAKTLADRKKYFLQALEWDSNMPHAFLELGLTVGYKNIDSAKLYFAKATELLPNWILPLVKLSGLQRYAGQDAEALATLNLAEGIDSNSVLIMYEKATLNMQLHFYEIAEPLLEKVIKSSSEEVCFPCAHMNLGYLHMQRGRPKVAQTHFKTALEIYKNNGKVIKGFCNPCAYVNIGLGYWQMDSLEQAEISFKKAIEVDSNFVYGYQNLGALYLLMKNIDEGEKYLKKSIMMRPKEGVNYSNLGEGYYEAKRYAEAEEYLLKGIELDTTNPNTYICLGDVYRVTKRYSLAEINYKNALLINAHRIEAMLGLGIIFTTVNRLKEAEQWYLKVIQEDPKNNLAPFGIAVIYSHQKKAKMAFDYLEQSFMNGFQDMDKLNENAEFDYLRKHNRKWNLLIKKYFPEKIR